MSRALRIDWPLCAQQASLMTVMHIIFSTTEAIRLTSDAPTPGQFATVLAISLPTWFPLGLILAAGAQWAHAAPRHRFWRSTCVVLIPALVNGQINEYLLRFFSPAFSDVPLISAASYPFAFWRGALGSTLFFSYCRLVQRSRERQDLLARAEIERASVEVRLREARASALEQCVDTVLLERTVAALRTAYTRSRGEGDALLDALVEFLRLAMPAVRSSSTLNGDAAAVSAWNRLRERLASFQPACAPVTEEGEIR
jgi:hypothetical protein